MTWTLDEENGGSKQWVDKGTEDRAYHLTEGTSYVRCIDGSNILLILRFFEAHLGSLVCRALLRLLLPRPPPRILSRLPTSFLHTTLLPFTVSHIHSLPIRPVEPGSITHCVSVRTFLGMKHSQ